MGRKLKDLP